jgi:hypothetical protein
MARFYHTFGDIEGKLLRVECAFNPSIRCYRFAPVASVDPAERRVGRGGEPLPALHNLSGVSGGTGLRP